uniref:Diphthamide biosynthesis protein 3 n=1 Tax=Globodera rostochiensis TaxID=31243 RepID=A0A914I901_GLORO
MEQSTASSLVFHDEVEIEDFEFDENLQLYHYPCPCGDRFEITKEQLEAGEDVATCPSCSLMLRVIYDMEQFVKLETLHVEPVESIEAVK